MSNLKKIIKVGDVVTFLYRKNQDFTPETRVVRVEIVHEDGLEGVDFTKINGEIDTGYRHFLAKKMSKLNLVSTTETSTVVTLKELESGAGVNFNDYTDDHDMKVEIVGKTYYLKNKSTVHSVQVFVDGKIHNAVKNTVKDLFLIEYIVSNECLEKMMDEIFNSYKQRLFGLESKA